MNLPTWLIVFILSMLPISELRGAIPYGVANNMPLWEVVTLSIAGNMLPVPFILLFLKPVEKFLRRWKIFDVALDKIFQHTRNKTKDSIEKWQTAALILFVAIPLPVTGAWTGSLAAYLFNLEFKKSIIAIFTGVLIAAFIVTVATITGIKILGG
ncbi:MAG: small multi-drug export protein [Thermoplasmata archaeon]|nr:small multi-drug export protein [Thermoplasmata archaeon]